MKLGSFVLSFAVLVAMTAVAPAQSLPNYGPNAPARGDTFGKPPSGTYPPPSGYRASSGTYPPPSGYRAYRARAHAEWRPGFRKHRHAHRHHRHW